MTALKKWVIIFTIVIFCIIGTIAGVYVNAMGPKKEASTEAFNKAKQESELVTMDSFYMYNGEETFSVVVGENADGEKLAVWIPEDDKQKITVEKYSDGKSKEEIRKIVVEEHAPEKIISIKLGMERNVALWEVTYIDNSNRYNYDYYDFKTGEWLKYYRSI